MTTRRNPGKYFIVTNLTASTQIVVPARKDMAGLDLVIPGNGYLEVDDPEKWQDERNLMRAQANGLVKAEWLDERPVSLPSLPASYRPSDPRLYNMLREIVFGPDEVARDLILCERRHIGRAGQPIDYDWMESSGTVVLEGAAKWLELWGPPEDKIWRVDLIRGRLEQIKHKTIGEKEKLMGKRQRTYVG